MNLWQAAKWVALVVLALGLTLGLGRLFSGPEDAWMRAPDGSWVAHGHPAGPPPPADYRPPWTERVLPWVLLAAGVGGLAAAALFSSRSPANRDALGRSVRFHGAVSIIAGVLAAALMVALAASLTSGLGAVFEEPLAVVLALLGLSGFLALLGAQAYGTKKALEAHYDLKRAAALLQDTVERLSESRPRREAR